MAVAIVTSIVVGCCGGAGELGAHCSPSTAVPSVRLPHSLRCANVSIIEHKECESAYPGNITETMLCASVRKEGKDSCQVSGQGLSLPSLTHIFTDTP